MSGRPSCSSSPRRSSGGGAARGGGPVLRKLCAAAFLGVMVVLPIAALLVHSATLRPGELAASLRSPELLFALRLTIGVSLAVAAINVVTGTLAAWVLVRYDFPGRRLLNSLVDVPFAIPTVVTGLMIVVVYGKEGVLGALLGRAGIEVLFARPGIVLALLVVTFPFVVRSVQPVLMAADREQEEAALTLGASRFQVFRRVVLPPIVPAVLMGAVVSFSRALGEFGSVIVVAGNIPMKTQLASVFIYGEIESGNMGAAIALSLILLAVSLLVLAAIQLIERLGRPRAPSGAKGAA